MSLVRSDLNQATPERTVTTSAKADKVKFTSPLAELKNGKVLFKQKPISFENLSETMQEIVNFRECIKDISGPLSAFPEIHLPLIAKLVHESDKSVITLAKNVQSLLLPPNLDSSSQESEAEVRGCLTPSVVEHAIKAVAERVNYGITVDMEKPPAALCIWRWEVKNKDWLPKSMSDKAKKHLQAIFDALSEGEREAVLQNGKNNKISKGKETTTDPCTEDRDPNLLQEDKTRETSESRESSTKKTGRLKKALDPEMLAKEREKQEKKVIKAEKEKKVAEATKKSAAVFANFFKSAAVRSNRPSNTSQAESSTTRSTQIQPSEFELTFKSFVVKKDARVAPINYFVAQQQKRRREQRLEFLRETKEAPCIIDVDDEGVHPMAVDVDSKEEDVSRLSAQEVLQSFVWSQLPSLQPIARTLVARRVFKTEPKHCVRRVMHHLNDAEVQGDQKNTLKLTALLRNRRKIPAKVFVFHKSNRPGYIGTWTKSSQAIGPRTPFARDLLTFDYDHDSDAEWEQEEVGSADDLESLDESNEDDRSSAGSDLDDWLVDGDDIEIDSTSTSIPDDLMTLPTSPNTNSKRKSAGSSESSNKKRRIVPLIPFQKGPVWETEIGECTYEPFKLMRIQLFNDTPFPLDPFTFVSEPITLEKPNNPAVKDGDGLFVIPAVPERLLPKIPLSTDDAVGKRKALNSALPPKTSFPDVHVPLLLEKIGASTTNSFVVLLDSLFQDLKPLGVKKNALEVKLREVSEKDKSKKVWVVKEQAWSRHGLIKPT